MTVLTQSRALHGEGQRGAGIGGLEGGVVLLVVGGGLRKRRRKMTKGQVSKVCTICVIDDLAHRSLRTSRLHGAGEDIVARRRLMADSGVLLIVPLLDWTTRHL